MEKKSTDKKFSLVVIFILIFLLGFSCKTKDNGSKQSQNLTIFHAGSLAVPLKVISEEFEQLYPGVEVHLEAAGSVTCVRKITDLKRNCDILALADYSLIDRMMIPEYANWGIQFASNELCLAYTRESKYQNTIFSENWMETLSKGDVRYGRSDPDSDPCGYRTVLALKLAAKFYDSPIDFTSLLDKDREFIRPKETDLLALLETNTVDYIFIYKSVAVQHQLEFIEFPDSINLGNPAHNKFYSKASVEIPGKKPGEVMQIDGQAMVYGFTVPLGAENPGLAFDFAKFLISRSGGLKIIEELGQTTIDVQLSPSSINTPELLK